MSDPLPKFTNPNPDAPFREPVARLAKVITDRIPVVLGKEKITKETVVKYFFDMSKSTYTIMVLGGLAALFGIVETNESGTISAILLGVVLSAVLSIIGYVISKR